MGLLDRYILKNFLVPFVNCLLGFVAIWFIIDLTDNASDFISGHASLLEIGAFYAMQIPEVLVLVLPIAMLLALLYALSRMSRSNEIIAMLTAGRSVVRILIPLMAIGLLTTAFSFFLNNSLAPQAAAKKEQQLQQFKARSESDYKKGSVKEPGVSEILFRAREDHRTWFVTRLTQDPISRKYKELRGIHITQQDATGRILEKYYAASGRYNAKNKTWIFRNGKTVRFDAKGQIVGPESYWPELTISHWSETPWQLASYDFDPQQLSVSELRQYLHYNANFSATQLAPYRTQLQYRWALPWMCFIVVFIAAPLGIVYSRRGVLAGVASSIFIFFAMTFLTNLFLALGKGARISPWSAAWMPDIFFAALGLYLLYMRSANREVPIFSFKKPRRKTANRHLSLTANAN